MREKGHSFIIYIAVIVVFLLSFFMLLFSASTTIAKADSDFTYEVSLLDIKCKDFDGNETTYNIENNQYAREIKLFYNINAPYYMIEVYSYSDLSTPINLPQAIEVEFQLDIVGYEVRHNGRLKVVCYALTQDKEIQNTVETEIRSDNLEPKEPIVNEMTEWVRHTQGYLVKIKLGEDNGNAGINKAGISIVYDDGEIDTKNIAYPEVNEDFYIYKECTIDIVVYDNAGNKKIVRHEFKKFDSIAPTAPSIIAIPEREVGPETNGYARKYTIKLEFGEDNQNGSGVNENSMKYILNGDTFSYDGGFLLNEQRDYTISAYYEDNAGNKSPEAELKITNMDRIEPMVSSIKLTVNLMNEYPYKVLIECSDANSGLDNIVAENISAEFVHQEHNIYVALLKNLDVSSIKIKVTDKVGNSNITNIVTHHFSNLDIEDFAVRYHQKFFTLDEQEYKEDSWDSIISLYADLNILLMAEQTSLFDLRQVAKELDSVIAGETQRKYIIENAPTFMSSALLFKIEDKDIHNRKKGDIVTMVLSSTNYDEQTLEKYEQKAKDLTQYEKCFLSVFALTFYHNGDLIDYNMENGVEVSMPIPRGFESRYFSIMDTQTQELIEKVEVINNEIIFVINEGGNYVLITEGSQELPIVSPPKGIKVFGKNISYLSFGLAIAGAVLFLVLAIVLLTLQHKKTGK